MRISKRRPSCTGTRVQAEHGEKEDMPPYPSTSNVGQVGPPGQDWATRRFTTDDCILLNRRRDHKTTQHTPVIFDSENESAAFATLAKCTTSTMANGMLQKKSTTRRHADGEEQPP